MTPADAYRVLEVAPGVEWPLIRESYLDLVRVWHPDRFEADPRLRAKAEVRLADINAAYRALDRRRNEPSLPPPGVERRRPSPAVQPPAPTVRPSSRGAYAAAILVAAAIALLVSAWLIARPESRPAAVGAETPHHAATPEAVASSRTVPVVSGFSQAPDVASGFSRTSDVVSGFSRTSASSDAPPPDARSFIARETDVILAKPTSPTATRQQAAGSQ